MTVAVVGPHPATMPGYNNSVDLDEVHSLSRYCFLYSSSWEACSVFYFMLRAKSCIFLSVILLQDITSRLHFQDQWTTRIPWTFQPNSLPGHFHGSLSEPDMRKQRNYHFGLVPVVSIAQNLKLRFNRLPRCLDFLLLWLSLLSGP